MVKRPQYLAHALCEVFIGEKTVHGHPDVLSLLHIDPIRSLKKIQKRDSIQRFPSM